MVPGHSLPDWKLQTTGFSFLVACRITFQHLVSSGRYSFHEFPLSLQDRKPEAGNSCWKLEGPVSSSEEIGRTHESLQASPLQLIEILS